MHWSDTHFHIDDFSQADSVISAAKDAGVHLFLLQATSPRNMREVLHVAQKTPEVYAAIGEHPLDLEQYTRLEDFLPLYDNADTVRAVGEIGLDYHYAPETAPVQQEILGKFLALARKKDLPAVIHCRDAFADCHRLVTELLPQGYPFIIHSFTGTTEEARMWLQHGAYLSVNGMVTFKKADNIREALQVIPMEKLLLETDSPYLAPVPLRGTQNCPANIPIIGAKVAEQRGLSEEELRQITWDNARRILRLE